VAVTSSGWFDTVRSSSGINVPTIKPLLEELWVDSTNDLFGHFAPLPYGYSFIGAVLQA
jgi:hypothetical protein